MRRARAQLQVYIRRRKKRQKNSETDTSRERSVAEQNGSLPYSASCPFSSFPVRVFPSLKSSQSVHSPSISHSISPFSSRLCLSFFFSLSVYLSSNHLPVVFLFTAIFRATSTTDDAEKDHEGKAHFPEAASSSRSRLRPYSRARAARREKLPGPNHASAAIFYLRRESGV